MAWVPKRPRYEIADIVRHYGESYLASRRVPKRHRTVMTSIATCRTIALGGHLQRCDYSPCRDEKPAYNSCRNRHDPKCCGW